MNVTSIRTRAYWQPMQELFDQGVLGEGSRSANTPSRQRIDEGEL